MSVTTVDGISSYDILFSEEEKKIYSYFNGEEDCLIDPLLLYDRFSTHREEITLAYREMETKFTSSFANKLKEKASVSIYEKICKIFDVRLLDDEGGVTQSELESLLNTFVTWYLEVEKKYQRICDLCDGNIANFKLIKNKEITYLDFVGFIFNSKRIQYKHAYPVYFGTCIALGSIKPPIAFFEANNPSKSDAIIEKAAFEMSVQRRSDSMASIASRFTKSS